MTWVGAVKLSYNLAPIHPPRFCAQFSGPQLLPDLASHWNLGGQGLWCKVCDSGLKERLIKGWLNGLWLLRKVDRLRGSCSRTGSISRSRPGHSLFLPRTKLKCQAITSHWNALPWEGLWNWDQFFIVFPYSIYHQVLPSLPLKHVFNNYFSPS